MDAALLEARQLDYLAYATASPMRPDSIGSVIAHLERDARDPSYAVPGGAIPDDAWDARFDKMWRLRDTSDFDALGFVNLLYAYRGHPAASEELWRAAEEALLTFKYWYTDPTPERIVDGEQVVDTMWYWTENHVLIFKTCEFLVGRLLPDRVFAVTGLTGAQHAERARPEILRWLEERARFGFTEWHSNVYYNLDMRPLLALIEWSGDPVIEQRASMVLDLVLLDVALHLHRGTFGATHGRSYIKDKASATTEDSFPQSKLLFDDTELGYASPFSTSGAVFARARRYRVPEVIRRVAVDDAPMVDRQRMNLPLDEVPPADPASAPPPEAPFGLDYRDEANLTFWWSMGSQSVWMMLPLTLQVGEREELWDAQFAPFKQLRDIVWNPADPEGSIVFAQQLAQGLWPSINQALLKEVNTYTYRTRDYMLSTAQDYRKGVRGSQTHTWQATLSERAMVFSQHPGYLPVAPGDPIPDDWNWQQQDEPGPGYWTGEGAQPRSAQHENVGISLYAPQYVTRPAVGFDFLDETHAYFPVAHFDEVIRAGHWTFGRKDDGYVALYSWRLPEWRRGQPEVFENAGQDFDLVAPGGATNVWIVELGSADDWPGGFADFRAAVEAAAVVVTPTAVAFEVAYDSPSQGTIEWAWEGPLVVNGTEHPISDYPRFDNRYLQVPFDDTRYHVRHDGFELLLDFDSDTREAAAPPDSAAGVRARFAAIWEAIRAWRATAGGS
ncbi:MAG: hypothetical protein MJE66_05550 [Proteobacteria bacterium]|nr:hypothetical protein [Pseudomonadota bacterium]